jgi:hypothetical protein
MGRSVIEVSDRFLPRDHTSTFHCLGFNDMDIAQSGKPGECLICPEESSEKKKNANLGNLENWRLLSTQAGRGTPLSCIYLQHGTRHFWGQETLSNQSCSVASVRLCISQMFLA